MFSATVAPKIAASCGTGAMRSLRSFGSTVLHVDAIDKDLALDGVIKTHDELEYGRFTSEGPRGNPLARRDREIEVLAPGHECRGRSEMRRPHA